MKEFLQRIPDAVKSKMAHAETYKKTPQGPRENEHRVGFCKLEPELIQAGSSPLASSTARPEPG